jgi:hypothetical protein
MRGWGSSATARSWRGWRCEAPIRVERRGFFGLGLDSAPPAPPEHDRRSQGEHAGAEDDRRQPVVGAGAGVDDELVLRTGRRGDRAAVAQERVVEAGVVEPSACTDSPSLIVLVVTLVALSEGKLRLEARS